MSQIHPTRGTLVAMVVGGLLFIAGVYLVIQNGIPLSREPLPWTLAITGGLISWWARARYVHTHRSRRTNEGKTT